MQIYAFILATFLSILGSAISMVAIPWFLLEITGNVTHTAVVMAIRVLPIIVSTIYGSRILDKYSKRNVCIISDIFSCVAILMLPILYHADVLTIVPLVILICISSALEHISGASVSAMAPDMLENTTMGTEKLNGIMGSLHNFGDLAGPIVGGLIVATYGTSIALSIDALTFALSAIVFYLFIKPNTPVPEKGDEHYNSNSDIKAGFLFISSQYCIFFIAVLSVVVNLLIVPLLTLILPFIAKTQFDGALDLGFLISVFGVGTFIASLFFTIYGKILDKLLLILLCNSMLLVSFICASLSTDKYTLGVVLFFVGLSIGFFGPLDDTLLQRYTPKSLRGRVFLAYSTIRYATIPVSMVIFGFLLNIISLSAIFIIMASCLFMTLIWLLINRKKFIEESKRLIENGNFSNA